MSIKNEFKKVVNLDNIVESFSTFSYTYMEEMLKKQKEELEDLLSKQVTDKANIEKALEEIKTEAEAFEKEANEMKEKECRLLSELNTHNKKIENLRKDMENVSEDSKPLILGLVMTEESIRDTAEDEIALIKEKMEELKKNFLTEKKVEVPTQNAANNSQQKIIMKETRVKPNGYDHDASVTNAKITLISDNSDDGCMIVCDQNKKGFKCYFDPKMDKFLYSVSRDHGAKYFDTTFATIKKYVDFNGKHFITGIFAEGKKESAEK